MNRDIQTVEDRKKADAVYIGLKLNKRTDADILEAIGGCDTRQAELRRFIRIGMKELELRRERKEARCNEL